MFPRAFVAAALALLISGDVARFGWDAAGSWHFIFPYLWLFVLLEACRARHRLEDGAVFLAGAAMAMFYGGVYGKDLQHGFHPLGVDWPGVLCAFFDGGMMTVLALHVAGFILPRGGDETVEIDLRTVIFLVFVFGAATAVYGMKTAFDFYRAERVLGPTWLVADILFAGAAWALARLAWRRAEEEADASREQWIWFLAVFAVWLPGARLIARACMAMELPGVPLYFFVCAWTAVAMGVHWAAFRRRMEAALPRVTARSRLALAAALWRAAGALIFTIFPGAELNDSRAAGIFSIAIDWPSRALFAWAFLTSRLKV